MPTILSAIARLIPFFGRKKSEPHRIPQPDGSHPFDKETLLKLKPCPFCASYRTIKGERYFAMCVDCGATGPERAGKATESKIVSDWNSRPLEKE